jgi:hypothetical protein
VHRHTPQPRFALPSSDALARALAGLARFPAAFLRPQQPLLAAARAVLRDAERRTRRSPRLSFGVAAATVVAALVALIATASGSGPADAVSSADAISSSAPAHPAGGARGPHGTVPRGAVPRGTGTHGAGTHGTGAVPPAASSPPASAPAVPAQPYLIYDSVHPQAIPGHHVIATYADGPHPTPAGETAGQGPVLWIDTVGTDYAAAVLDVEPGCASPATAASWAARKLAKPGAVARIYTMLSEWPAVKASVAALPAGMQARIHWWIADPTGYPHVVPGAQATQWYWGSSYDISTAEPDF